MLYDLDTIQATIERVLGKTVSKSRLKTELEKAIWQPGVGRMIAVANNYANLSNPVFGVFVRMKDGGYQVEGGVIWKHARALTPEEIAKCF